MRNSIRIILLIFSIAALMTYPSCGGGRSFTATQLDISNNPTTTPAISHTIVTVASTPRRWESTATLLDSGDVLIAGGENLYENSGDAFCPDANYPNASLFNASTTKITDGAALMEMRYFHTATPLKDGRVLLAGGIAKCGAGITSAELFDPATATFSRTGSMSTGRAAFTATRLEDGRVLVVGGWPDNKTAEIYDPAIGTFTPAGSLETGRTYHTATLLPNGKVLIFGGMTSGTPWLVSSAEIFNPTKNSFEAPIPINGRMRHTATLLPGGTVLIAGGDNLAGGSFETLEQFDPSSGVAISVGTLLTPRYWHTATLLRDGVVLFAGGEVLVTQLNGVWSQAIASTELYDSNSRRTLAGPMLNDARSEHNATLLKDGRVLFTDGGALSAEIFQ